MKLLLWGRLRFLWQYRKNRLARALAVIGSRRGVAPSELEIWALYRLGMYGSVTAAKAGHFGWRGHFARAVSLAACGQPDAACEAVDFFLLCPGADSHSTRLADALAPFLPARALELVDGRSDVSPALRTALALRNGQRCLARLLLDNLSTRAVQTQPELLLLRTNVCGGAIGDQLKSINVFLQAHDVSPVRLRDVTLAPSPTNVMAQAIETAEGPLVTVLMTTFRTGARASAAIESLCAQAYRNLEVLVVDDGSADETPELIQALAQHDPRVRCIALPRNVGTYAAKMIGLALARGEFITCHDSDDWSHPEKIARQVAPLLADKKLIGTISSWLRMQDDGQFYARPVYPLMRMNPSSLLFRRERVLREAGAWDCVRTGADSEFLARLRIVFGPKSIKKIGQPLSLGSHRPDSLMTAASTGYSETGMSPQRLAYWEAWSHWHIDMLARGQLPFIPADVRAALACRPFAVPEALLVSAADVEACWQAVVGEQARSGDARTPLPLVQ